MPNLREQQEHANETKQAAADFTTDGEQSSPYDGVLAKRLFETKCSECHETTLVEKKPPESEAEARELVGPDGRGGADGQRRRTAQIVRYLIETYAKNSSP